MMKLIVIFLLSHVLHLTTAFIGSSSIIHGIKQRNPLDTCTLHRRYDNHLVRTRSSYAKITPESAGYQEEIKGNFTNAVVVTKPFSKVNITALVAPINVLQACTAGFCVAGRLPIFQNLMSFLVGKGLILAGLAVMGISWDETRKNNNMESDKKKSLITTGLYSKVRHPFLAGQWLVLIGFAGSYWKQQSPLRYFLAGLYYLILRKKVEMEEEQLEQEYGHEYQVYKVLVKGQLIPMEISSIFDTASRTSTARAKKEKEV